MSPHDQQHVTGQQQAPTGLAAAYFRSWFLATTKQR